ncbi:hypothetical protein FACS189494_11970 [Spirochaetia bacterium]|nr:hypothetical protein FACS189494_11970 [Spirochaetia bacterium]
MNKLHLVEGILTNDFNIEKIFSGIHRDITTQDNSTHKVPIYRRSLCEPIRHSFSHRT